MSLFRIRLELARCPEFPNGSPERGYDLVAPLTADGHLEIEEWRAQKEACRVRRFWPGEGDEHGHLAHGRAGWYFDYDEDDTEDDEPVFKLDRHTVRSGEYLSISDRDGELKTFRVAHVGPLESR